MSETRIAHHIGEAWERAEDRLPEYWRIRSLIEVGDRWEVIATDGRRIQVGRGPTEIAALDDLAKEND